MPPEWLIEADRSLLEAVDGAVSEAQRRAGPRLDYARGCPVCCLGPFPINRLDVLRLQEGLAELWRRDAEAADDIARRATEHVRLLGADFPGRAETGELGEDESRRQTFFTRHGSLPCPALDLRSGACRLYACRPLMCRTFGPPVRFGDQVLAACQLCFAGAEEDEEACRVSPDPGGLENDALDRLEAIEGERGETIIAYALAGPAAVDSAPS